MSLGRELAAFLVGMGSELAAAEAEREAREAKEGALFAAGAAEDATRIEALAEQARARIAEWTVARGAPALAPVVPAPAPEVTPPPARRITAPLGMPVVVPAAAPSAPSPEVIPAPGGGAAGVLSGAGREPLGGG